MSDTRFWFPKWNVICTYFEGYYYVVNGNWSFRVDENGLRYF